MLQWCPKPSAVCETLAALLLVFLVVSPTVAQDSASPDVLWDDFNHYVLVARPELAAASGQKLLDTASADALLNAVENSDFPDYLKALDRAAQYEAIQPVAEKLLNKLREAAKERSRDPERIQRDIEQLTEGRRPAMEATRRLKAAGQYAAPQLLAVLEDDNREDLHPYVYRAMIEIGPSMVYPLSAALPRLEPVTLGRVAQVLGELGYPQAIPPLKQVLETRELDNQAQRTVEAAFAKLTEDRPQLRQNSAAELFLLRGMGEFDLGTRGAEPLGYDQKTEQGVLWVYNQQLIAIPVPGPIYPDVLAMDSAVKALALDDSLAPALSLQLMANFRRQNRLPEGEQDPSYPAAMREPAFYAMLAGPQRLQTVLVTGLETQDPALALDAIRAMAGTAGYAALIESGDMDQPLIEGLSYPDRRVRFESALTLAQAQPSDVYPGAFRVVSVLSEAVRQGDEPIGLALAQTQEDVNRLNVLLNDMGYEVVSGTSLDEVSGQLSSLPGVDLILVDLPARGVMDVAFESEVDYKLANAPVLAVVSKEELSQVTPLVTKDRRVFSVADSDDTDAIRSKVEEIVETYGGKEIGGEEATRYALDALAALQQITQQQGVYRIEGATNALIEALQDSREPVVIAAAEVLANIDEPKAQQALADAALDKSGKIQLAMLQALAQSARQFGDMITESQANRLTQLVAESEGDLAEAAAQAHGALSLPTSQAVQLLNADQD